ncbi:MAG: gamma-glutamyl-gamma-aminobutyrate hydrolase family protein [Victivallaceae bacterium]
MHNILILLLALCGLPLMIVALPLIWLFRFGNRKRGPLIAVAVSSRWPYFLQYLRIPYDFAVWRAGGATLTVCPADMDNLENILNRASGIILTGGQDLAPQLHDGLKMTSDLLNFERDKLELRILKLNENYNLPMLCVCRGAQLLTVFNGGKLECYDEHRDKLRRHSSNLFRLGKHHTKILPDTKLYKILNRDAIEVMSFHHHAARHPGRLKISAFAVNDDCIEAVEDPQRDWTVGVQWHPELQAPFSRTHQRLFDALVKKAHSHLQ